MSHSERIQEAAKEIAGEVATLFPVGRLKTDIGKLAAAIISKHIPEQNEWVKVTPETMPPNSDDVMTCNNFKARLTASWEEGEWFFSNGTLAEMNERRKLLGFVPIAVTHWMPLPTPPRSLATPSEPLGVTKDKK